MGPLVFLKKQKQKMYCMMVIAGLVKLKLLLVGPNKSFF